MRIVGIIPARYRSNRLFGKPLLDINDKTLLLRVYENFVSVSKIDEIYVATEDIKVYEYCQNHNINVIMTSDNHKNRIERVHEISQKIFADFYVILSVDEPLITSTSINRLLPKKITHKVYVANAFCKILETKDIDDMSNIKIINTLNNESIYFSRSVIPYSKNEITYDYKKFVGLQCLNKSAIDFYISSKQGPLELLEDIDELRYLENGIKITLVEIFENTRSVDNIDDLEYIRKILS